MQLDIEPVTLKNAIPCKNHPNIPSGYYLSDQPSIRYCKNCALNVALCGRKIQKELTLEQQEKKNHITSFVKQLNQNRENIKISQVIYSQLQQYLHQVGKIMENKLSDIDNSINQLVSYREMLAKRYEEDVVRQLQKYQEIRKKSVNNEEQIMQILERIESNFGNFIQLQHSELFQTEERLWNETLLKSKESIASQTYYQQTKTYLTKHTCQFMEICSKLDDFRVYFTNVFISEFDSNKENSQISGTNTLESSNLVQQLKINLTANAQSKKRDNNHKRSITDRDNQTFSKKMNRKNANQIQQHSDCFIPSKKNNH